jgi:hypothetical protein
METSDLWVILSYSSLSMPHALVVLLCSNDLTHQSCCESDVEQ